MTATFRTGSKSPTGPKGAPYCGGKTHRTRKSKKVTARNAWIAKRLLQDGVLMNDLFDL